MEFVSQFIDLVLHLDVHLLSLVQNYGGWVYAILFAIVFCETGLVVTPFLPGDSLLFAAGALAAVDASHTLRLGALLPLLAAAAILGNTTNYWIGRYLGKRTDSGGHRFIKAAYRQRAEEYLSLIHISEPTRPY